VLGRPRSTYRSGLLLGGPPPRSHDITSRAVEAEGALLLVERKSNQWLFEFCPLLSVVEGCGLGTDSGSEEWAPEELEFPLVCTGHSKLPNPVCCAWECC
jgi:hypothetical protein